MAAGRTCQSETALTTDVLPHMSLPSRPAALATPRCVIIGGYFICFVDSPRQSSLDWPSVSDQDSDMTLLKATIQNRWEAEF